MRLQSALGARVVEAVGEAHAIEGVLGDAVHHAWWCDAEDLVDRRDHVVAVMELRARGGIGLDLGRPPDRHRVASAAEVPGQDHRALVRRAAGPGPSRVVNGIGLGPAKDVKAAKLIERLDLLLNGRDDAVVRHQLADRAFLALRRGAVVAPEVEDQCVVAVPERFDLVDDAPRLNIGVFAVGGTHLHQPALEWPLALRDALPGRHLFVPRSQLCLGGDPALLLGPLEHLLSVGVPAVVELALVLVDVLLGRVVGPVDRAAGPVHEEGPVRGHGLVLVQPVDGIVGQILVQVVALFGGLGRRHERRVANQVRLELRRLPGEESVEGLEAQIRRPVLERTGRSGLDGWCVVPLAPRSRGVAVILEHFCHECAALGNPPAEGIPVVRELGDDPGADPVMVASGEERRPSRRAQGGRMKPVVADPLAEDALEGRGVDLAAKRRRLARTRVVHQDNENVRSILGKPTWRHARLVDRLLHREADLAGHRCWRKRKGFLLLQPLLRTGHRVLPLLVWYGVLCSVRSFGDRPWPCGHSGTGTGRCARPGPESP